VIALSIESGKVDAVSGEELSTNKPVRIMYLIADTVHDWS
jgi:hypothetical protein